MSLDKIVMTTPVAGSVCWTRSFDSDFVQPESTLLRLSVSISLLIAGLPVLTSPLSIALNLAVPETNRLVLAVIDELPPESGTITLSDERLDCE